jgi:pyruvate/2-oxoglutarate dehydrogenase complex dihydrolipoamide acyltransferase (E2) component
MRLTLALLLVLALIAGAACTQAAQTPPETSPPTTAPPTQAPTTTPPPATTAPATETAPPAAGEAITPEGIEAARQVVFAYWEAYNSYDVDGVLALLEDSWREERADDIASEIGQMEGAKITLGVEEEAEPEVTEGTIAIKMFIDIPIVFMPDRHYIYYLKKIDGEWKIYSAEEVEG